ncbi:MAG TPA: S-methyl-5'-thioadenosine phosphorylase [Spirochaetota bacterium]|nr:S-methyl-5'-thioadenosine phosphorylase [Spirochaetota bacterium]
MKKASIGIIGGSGLYDIEGIDIVEEVDIDTPWGKPSDSIMITEVDGKRAAFLPRHGRGHRVLPHEINFRANIAALKMLGVEEILAFSAVGSLKEAIRPLDFIIPDQVIDRTKARANTYFGEGIAAHISFGHPFCGRLHQVIRPVAEEMGITLHTEETLICMEGPAFSTKAESNLYRSWGAGVINMSALPEAKLAREAEMCYAMICMCTDYDCWKEDEAHVSVEMLVDNLNKNGQRARDILKKLLGRMGQDRVCECKDTVKFAVITPPEKQNPESVKKLSAILPKYFHNVH